MMWRILIRIGFLIELLPMSLHVRHRVFASPHRLPACCVLAELIVLAALVAWLSLHCRTQALSSNPAPAPLSMLPCAQEVQPPPHQEYRVDLVQAPHVSPPEPIFMELPSIEPTFVSFSTPVFDSLSEEPVALPLSALSPAELAAESPPRPSQPRTERPSVASSPASDYTPPQYKSTPEPPYPPELRSRRLSGSVRVRILVSAQGVPTSVIILQSPHPAFSAAAKRQILASWRFFPARSHSSPVPSSVTTSIHFKI